MASSYPAYGASPQPQPPQQQYPYPPSMPYASTFTKADHARQISRTPSPTPSEEAELLRDGLLDWKALSNWRFWVRREWLWYYVIGGIILVLSTLIAVFDKQIVAWLTPATTWMHKLKFGWLIPIAIFFVISFPPLFGHEILAILCGLVWGLWIGFAIVAAGTYLGELGNFYAFKYCCRARGEKLEKENLNYACLAKVVREGGFPIALICRLSVMPGHFTTAIFSTCGMNVITFSIACILSMPKQLITVYIGVILEESGSGTESTRDKIISDAVLGVTILITAAAMWYLMRKMRMAKPDVIYARRKARQAKLERADFTPYSASNNSSNSVVFNVQGSETNIPLNPTGDFPYEAQHQRWDKDGHAVGFVGDPRLHAPEPRRAQSHGFVGGGGNGVGTGTSYPQSKEAPGGMSPLRQESADSADSNAEGRRDTFDIPRFTSPVQEPLNDPFELAPPDTRQASYATPIHSSPSPSVTQTPTQAQYANYNTQPSATTNVTSPPLPNPFLGTTPTQFNHPQVPSREHSAGVTNASFHAPDGHSRTETEETVQGVTSQAFSPPPPQYMTTPPK